MTNISTIQPVGCHLWTLSPLERHDIYTLKLKQAYFDDGHFSRLLLQCEECGQHYYRAYEEMIDWVDGNDPQYYTYLPIELDQTTLDEFQKLTNIELRRLRPCLVDDWLASGKQYLQWYGKTDQNYTSPLPLLKAATRLAVRYHTGQKRKGDDKPYIIHPVAVAMMLKEHGFSEETIAAGLCHDLLEDTECPERLIAHRCGQQVLDTVKAVTNNEKLPWREKKLAYIASVRNGSEAAKAVCCADKIHNLKSLLAAYEQQGDELWGKFNKGREDKLWFERGVLKMLQETWEHPLVNEYAGLVTKMKTLA